MNWILNITSSTPVDRDPIKRGAVADIPFSSFFNLLINSVAMVTLFNTLHRLFATEHPLNFSLLQLA
ncbi:hypothetical protein ATCC5870_01405 [Lactobacillus plantarum]|nr:hypothetical protein [Lactiplantibacillus plantarum]